MSKTLKDLENLMVKYDFPNSEAFGHKIIATEIIRQEAVKWIKKLKKDFKLKKEFMPKRVRLDYGHLKTAEIKSKNDGVISYIVDDLPLDKNNNLDIQRKSGMAMIAWIMYFFNLTEEDLK